LGLEKALSDWIREFNDYRAPEVTASLKNCDRKSFAIEFRGSFCETCGFYDYFDDFRIVLEDEFGLRMEIAEVEEILGSANVKFTLVIDSS
jgi:hypothetical protein